MRVKQLRKRGNDFIQPPKEPAKKKIAYGKYVYLLVLTSIVWFSGQWFFQRYFHINGTGFLECEETYIEARTPGRIKKIYCSVNDPVNKGDALVLLGDQSYATGNSVTNNSGWDFGSVEEERKIIDLQSDIHILKLSVAQNKTVVSQLKSEYKRAKKLFSIKAITHQKLMQIKDKLNQAGFDWSVLQIKLDSKIKTLSTYQRRYLIPVSSGETDTHFTSSYSREILDAPQDGIVAKVYKHVGEIAQVGEPVLKIVNPLKNHIKTYFPGTLENKIKVGDEVNITFENGEKSKGIIHKIYPTAFEQPNERRYNIELVERYIVAEIIPKHSEGWNRILDTKVNVTLNKNWFFKTSS